jgi:hypothetical protein
MFDPHDRSAIWPSYADLMTGLFAVMLALFVLSYWLLQHKIDAYRISATKYQQLQDIDAAVRSLEDEGYFTYQAEYKRHVFSQDVRFAVGASDIAPEYHDFLRAAGGRIAALIDRLRSRGSHTRYVLIVEGMASKDEYANNFGLSYQRALALSTLWNRMDIRFDSQICEIIIAGSGTGGAGRYSGDREHLNQRFLIQILPKIGTDMLLEQDGRQEPTRPSTRSERAASLKD